MDARRQPVLLHEPRRELEVLLLVVDECELEVALVILQQMHRVQQVARALVAVLGVPHIEEQAFLPLHIGQRPEHLGVDAVMDDVHAAGVEVERFLDGLLRRLRDDDRLPHVLRDDLLHDPRRPQDTARLLVQATRLT